MKENYFFNLYRDHFSVGTNTAIYFSILTKLVLILLIGFLLFRLVHIFSRRYLSRFVIRTKTSFDDLLIKNKVLLGFTRIIVLILLDLSLPNIFKGAPRLLFYADKLVLLLISFFIIWFIRSILFTLKDFLRTFSSFKDKPLESYVQIFMIFVWLLGTLVVFSILTGQSLLKFLTALGAFSAVLLLIFKDTILGFVASIQISINDTVRLNDWITMEKYAADGNVIEINLVSVIVKNFDNTITSIPTYSLISESFKNWRAMSNSGGRRIKRALYIKVNSIRFLNEDDITRLSKIDLISDYLQQTQTNIEQFNTANKINKDLIINGRNLTNLGVFRIYVERYLANHPEINKELLFMARQLAPTTHGIPLEIYAFSKNKIWLNYERIAADLFDHFLASVPFFDLELFEHPTGKDLSNIHS
ncbi:Miniconductance mechanosensitive channel YbdG [Tenacibaculum litopenaei]|uniref:mechanosensitive ion channel family protein n=1 Tax=Tenacibaculum litopenaei TaxID=396016 RepID=UPI003895B703